MKTYQIKETTIPVKYEIITLKLEKNFERLEIDFLKNPLILENLSKGELVIDIFNIQIKNNGSLTDYEGMISGTKDSGILTLPDGIILNCLEIFEYYAVTKIDLIKN